MSKRTILPFLACLALSAAFAPSSWANHRTGEFVLPESLVAGDFNEDGNPDLAVLLTGFDSVAIFIGDGKGGFKLEGHIAVDTLPKGLAVADVNGDGHLDLIVASAWGYTSSILLGDGKGGFSLAEQPDAGGQTSRLILADFNGDGHLDMALAAHVDGLIHVLLGDGMGGFGLPSDIGKVAVAYSLAAGDFNHDGRMDLAVTQGPLAGAGHVGILKGDGFGGFSIGGITTSNDPSSVQVGDLNGDGILDLVVSGAQPQNTGGNFVATFLGDGSGNFTPHTTMSLGTGNIKGELAVGDFNGDGKLDVAVAPAGTSTGPGNQVLVFLGDGAGGLSAPVGYTTGGKEEHSVIAVDVNNDGHLDLVVTDRTSGSVSVLLGDGTGHFTLVGTYSVVA
jgi:hypothetical protein